MADRPVRLNLEFTISDLIVIQDTLFQARDWNTGYSKDDKVRIASKIDKALDETKVKLKVKREYGS